MGAGRPQEKATVSLLSCLSPAAAPVRGSCSPQGLGRGSCGPCWTVPHEMSSSPTVISLHLQPCGSAGSCGLGEDTFAFSPEAGNLGGFLSQSLEPLIFSK